MNLENPYSPPESDVSLVEDEEDHLLDVVHYACLLYTSPSPRDKRQSRMPSSA